MGRLNKKRSSVRLVPIVIAIVLLCCTVLLLVFGDLGRFALGPCTAGREGAAEGVSGGAKELLETRNFEASPRAIEDLKGGVVDERLVATLQTIANAHRICVDAFKAGHYFLPGVPDGPLIPDGYPDAGLSNTHYYGRAVDIRRVDGKPVRGNGTDPHVLDIGDIISRIPPQERPDQIIGPEDWVKALGGSSEEGWILNEDELEHHKDHIHLGYIKKDGTWNTR